MTPADRTHPLAAFLAAAAPAALLTLGGAATALAARLCPPACRRSQAAAGETPHGRYDATLLSSDHAALGAAGWTQLLGHLRIRVSPCVWVLAESAHPPGDADYRALGFTCLPPWREWRCYAYDLHSYKATPDWLNARYWAHPERWEP